jgi:hypothetical protein
VLYKNNGSDEEIVYVTRCQKKKKLVPFLPALQSSDEVQVVEQVTLNLEVKSQDLPKTGRFGDYATPADKTALIGSKTVLGSSSNKSVNLLGDSSNE